MADRAGPPESWSLADFLKERWPGPFANWESAEQDRRQFISLEKRDQSRDGSQFWGDPIWKENSSYQAFCRVQKETRALVALLLSLPDSEFEILGLRTVDGDQHWHRIPVHSQILRDFLNDFNNGRTVVNLVTGFIRAKHGERYDRVRVGRRRLLDIFTDIHVSEMISAPEESKKNRVKRAITEQLKDTPYSGAHNARKTLFEATRRRDPSLRDIKDSTFVSALGEIQEDVIFEYKSEFKKLNKQPLRQGQAQARQQRSPSPSPLFTQEYFTKLLDKDSVV